MHYLLKIWQYFLQFLQNLIKFFSYDFIKILGQISNIFPKFCKTTSFLIT